MANSEAQDSPVTIASDSSLDRFSSVHEHYRFLAETNLILLGSFNYEATLSNITHLIVPNLADWCAVYLADPAGHLYLESGRHIDPAKTELIWELDRRSPFSVDAVAGPSSVLHANQAELIHEVPPPRIGSLFLDSKQIALIEGLGIGSYMCLPLKDQEKILGVLFMVANESSKRHYTETDLNLARKFAHSASLAINNARTAGVAESKFRELVDGIDAIVWESDVKRSHYSFISKKTEEIIGYSGKKWLTEPDVWAGIIHPSDRAQVLAGYCTATSKGRDLDFQYRAMTRDGRTVSLRDVFYIVKDNRGTPISVRGIIVDVTEQHRVAEALQRCGLELTLSQQRLRSLVNGVNAILWEADVERSNYSFVSEKTQEILGHPPEHWLRERDFWMRIIHPVDRDRIIKLYLRAAATARDDTLEYQIIAADGKIKWVRDIFQFERAPDQSLSARGIIIDVTSSHEKDEALLKSEAALRIFAENVKDFAFITLDTNGIITNWNLAAQRITGYASEAALGQPLEILFTPEDREADIPRLELEKAQNNDSIENNRWMTRKDGSRFWCMGVLTALRDQEGQLLGFIKFARDMTEQKFLEEELRRAKEAAEVASESKSQFLASMSHELRTPLGAMIGFADALLDAQMTEDKRLQYAETIRRSGAQLVTLIDDILDLSKVEAGHLEVERHEFSITELMREVFILLSSRATEKKLELKLSHHGPIPKTIRSDPSRLRQILINIIGNAIKFTEQGRIEVNMTLTKQNANNDSRLLTFIVNDSGIGIAPEYQDRLFQAFIQADQSIARVYGGTGLGLVLSRRLAHALGGDVTLLESAPGQGSSFKITVDTGPLENTEALESLDTQSTATSSAALPSPVNEKPLSGIKVLVVDDAPDNRVLITHILKEKGGAQVDSVEDGKIGVEAALRGSFDVILMDMQMPRMDGYETTATLRRNGYEKPIIALTAHVMKEERLRCLAAGCDDFLGKPINNKLLFDTVLYHTSASRVDVERSTIHLRTMTTCTRMHDT